MTCFFLIFLPLFIIIFWPLWNKLLFSMFEKIQFYLFWKLLNHGHQRSKLLCRNEGTAGEIEKVWDSLQLLLSYCKGAVILKQEWTLSWIRAALPWPYSPATEKEWVHTWCQYLFSRSQHFWKCRAGSHQIPQHKPGIISSNQAL